MKIIRTISTTDDGTCIGCRGGKCPSIHVTSDGQIVVQGYVISDDEKAVLQLPSAEDAIVFPREIFESLVMRYNSKA